MKNLAQYFEFCQERERIRVKKDAGMPPPWTKDEVLQSCFFCNVFREDDKVTRWFREAVRDPVSRDQLRAFAACVAFRWFNKIDTGNILIRELLFGWNTKTALRSLSKQREKGLPVFGAAYIISSPLGWPKIEWAVTCAGDTIAKASEILTHATSLQAMHKRLAQERGLGRFMSYEIVTDLRHTRVLEHAPDIMTWANPGPGCARGLGWLTHDTRHMYRMSHTAIILPLMQQVLQASREYCWQRPWEMREVEHTLCEYDKWRRFNAGQRPKRRYPQ